MFLAQTVSILYRCRKVAKKEISKTSNMVAQKMYIVEDMRVLYNNTAHPVDMRVLYNNTAHLVMRVDNSLTCEKRMTSFHKEERFGPIQLINPVTYFEMPLPNYKSQLSCICVLGVFILLLSMIFRLNFGNVRTV